MDHEALIRSFEAGRMPDDGFNHAQHVRVAWYYLRHYPFDEAAARFVTALKAFATAQGTPQLYDETITTTYLVRIHQRLDGQLAQDWPAFAAANADLLRWNRADWIASHK